MGLRVVCWVLTAFDCLFPVTITISGSNSRVPASRYPFQNRVKNYASLGASKVLQALTPLFPAYSNAFNYHCGVLQRTAVAGYESLKKSQGGKHTSSPSPIQRGKISQIILHWNVVVLG